MKQLEISLFIITITIIIFLVRVMDSLTISKNLVDVIDAASSRYIASKEWRQTLDSFGIYLQTPGCTSLPQYPSKFELSRNYLTLCYDNEAFDIWPAIYRKSGELLVNEIKQQYKLDNLTAVFKTLDTTAGYFSVMKNAVDTGICDVSLSATAISGDRPSQVHFQFVVSDGSVFQSYAQQQLPKATIKSIPGYDDAWNMILNKTAHAFVADALDLYVWVRYHKSSCATCKVILFGDELRFGTFITNQFQSSSVSTWRVENVFWSLLLIVFMMFIN
ncbi:predicted protein [Naegleria gruberi]|uniref:Predicted protein n=1 Tax=Naegleria gruberi TaxID=5762 RepID=D2W431_NAEGR|nr:uncharacterized protein NAEGRDRAFT_76161 [Naegleria gruberi]EFC36191.1 predicted protein [Naegleria gruberi]|eukprot:XP_002668935.1 predicted protein [Naegleria gruberi strain NEG-M]